MMLMAEDGVDLSSSGGEDLKYGGGLEASDLLIDLDSLMTTMEVYGPPPPQHTDVLTSQDKLTDAHKVFFADHKHFSGKHTMDQDQDAPVKPKKKKKSEQFLGDLSADVPSATRRKIITHLEEELTDANERIVLLSARKKKITKLLVALRYPEEEEDVDSAGDEESEESDY